MSCAKGTPENPIELSAANEQAFQHYKECRAVGVFPNDPIVKRNAAAIRSIQDLAERRQRREDISEMAVLMLNAAK